MELSQAMELRRSVRSYKEQAVPEEAIREIIAAAELAPTWKNSQTGRYYVVQAPQNLESFREVTLPAFNQKSSHGAALIVTTFVKNVSGHTAGQPDNEAGNCWGAYDLGLQNAYMLLKATELGLDSLIMGIRDGEAIRRILSIPEEEEVMAVIAIGYGDQEPVFKARKPIDEIAHFC